MFALRNALLAKSDPNERPPIEVQTVSESGLKDCNLTTYDCLMLSNVARFTTSEARQLDNYLVRGGSLVFFLGDRVQAENYNRVLTEGPLPILPARLEHVATNEAGTLNPLEYRHPILEKFRGHGEVQLQRSLVERYFKVKLLETAAGSAGQAATELAKSPLQVAAEVANGDPLIVAHPVSRGRVVLVTTSADSSWQMMTSDGNYEPLVRQILDWCLAGQAQPRNVLVGDALESTVAGTFPAASTRSGTSANPTGVTIERPDGRRTAVQAAGGDGNAWSYDDTQISGIYSAQFGQAASPVQLFAVNLKTAESDLKRLSRDELQDDVLPGVAVDYQTAWQAGAERLTLSDESASQLHVELLYAAAGLLLLETVFAWRMGYTRR